MSGMPTTKDEQHVLFENRFGPCTIWYDAQVVKCLDPSESTTWQCSNYSYRVEYHVEDQCNRGC